jgi:hypothetical protein
MYNIFRIINKAVEKQVEGEKTMFTSTNLNYEMYMMNTQRLHREAAQARLLNQIKASKKSNPASTNLLQSLYTSLHFFHKAHQH